MQERSLPSVPNAPAAAAEASRDRSIAALAKQASEKPAPFSRLLLHRGAERLGELLDVSAALGEIPLQTMHDGGLDRWRETQPPSGFVEADRRLSEELLEQLSGALAQEGECAGEQVV